MRSKGRQDITYWSKSGENAYGEETFATPILLKGRWEEKSEVVMTPEMEEITSSAIVFLEVATGLRGYLALGDFSAIANPVQAGAREIKTVVSIPSLRTNQMEYRAVL